VPDACASILVLDANQRSALAVVRSLGRHKHLRVLAADETVEGLAGHSKYCQGYFQCPSPRREPFAFEQWLLEFVTSNGIDWIFPVTEISSQSVLLLHQQLGACRIPFANHQTVLSLANKWGLINLAEKLGVPHPASSYFTNSAALVPDSITQFPVVLKPCLSRLRLAEGWLDTAVHVARNTDELGTLLRERPYFRDHPFMLQEFIPGKGAGIFALYDNGKPITFFAHRRLREKPPSGGVSVLSESVVPEPHMLAMARQLLDAVKWHGVAMVEFRVTPEGKAYLMEVNTRFWGSLQLAVDAGVDFPYWLYQICNGEVPPRTNYRVGRRLRWLLGDLDSLYLTLSDRQCLSVAQKLRRIWDFLTPHPFSTRHEINRWDDLRPAWYELKTYLRALRG
jgi:predicted ATP-grasp superfamily ATP-dependent carboligase